jgi:enterochelin esterase-like enzyme
MTIPRPQTAFMLHRCFIALVLFTPALAACSAFGGSAPTASALPTAVPSITPSPTITPTATPLACLTQAGQVISSELDTTTPPQQFLIYLPPCYDQMPDERYPVLYLLHGQTYQDDQWVRLGANIAADNLIHTGQAPPFLLVFPDDRYWNLPPGDFFGDRLINNVIPYVDQNYRTLADREHRALGGLSRGGGWAIHLLLTHYELFGTIGLHSPAIFPDDAAILQRLVAAMPPDGWPRLWIDAGDHDSELGNARLFEGLLTSYEVPHEWRMYTGDHTNSYWQAHVTEYLQWYAEGFQAQEAPAPDATATP